MIDRLAGLAEENPKAGKQLDTLRDHITAKQERLTALICYCAAYSELNILRMYAEYGAALDAIAVEPMIDEAKEASDEVAASLDSRERAARTKRLRSRRNAIKAAASLALQRPGEWRIEDVALISGVSLPTIYNHFPSKSLLAVAAYRYLVENELP